MVNVLNLDLCVFAYMFFWMAVTMILIGNNAIIFYICGIVYGIAFGVWMCNKLDEKFKKDREKSVQKLKNGDDEYGK